MFRRQRVINLSGAGFLVLVVGVAVGCAPDSGLSSEELAVARAELERYDALVDPEGGVEAAEAWLERAPGSPEIRAWYVHHLAAVGRHASAHEQIASLERDHPESDWTAWAKSTVPAVVGDWDLRASIVEASREALAGDPADAMRIRTHAEVLRRSDGPQPALDFLDGLPTSLSENPDVLIARAAATNHLRLEGADVTQGVGALEGPSRDDVWAIYERAKAANPDHVRVLYEYAVSRRGARQPEEALELAGAALELSPRSMRSRVEVWRGLDDSSDLAADEHRAEMHALLSEFLETDGSPQALSAVALQYDRMEMIDERDEIEARVITDYPEHHVTDEVRYRQYFRSAIDLQNLRMDLQGDLYEGEERAAAIERARALSDHHVAEMQAMRSAPPRERPERRLDALEGLLYEWDHRGDVKTREETYALISDLYDGLDGDGSYMYIIAAQHLARFPEHLDFAREVAVRGFSALAPMMEDEPLDEWAPREYLSGLYGALGWIEFLDGNADAGEHLLLKATEIGPRKQIPNGLLGRLYEAKYRTALGEVPGGVALETDPTDLDAAERYYELAEQYYAAAVSAEELLFVNPYEDMLRDLFVAGRGSDADYEAYRADLDGRLVELASRRVLEERLDPAVPVPPFSLTNLDGGIVASEELLGHITVVNFWGEWCPPCVAEMPHLREFQEKYRDDPLVQVLTINSDTRVEDVREYLAENGFDFRVLLNDGYSDEAGIPGWPTTWFVDQDGLIQFTQVGLATDLVDEFSIRVEALRGP